MLTVCTFKWAAPKGYRSTFGPEAVNTLARMVARHYQAPHEFVCITDDAAGIDASVRVVPLWHDFADVPNPSGVKHPSCYRRLRLFSPAIVDILGQRFVAIDLDCVLTDDVRPLWDRPEDFVIYGGTNPNTAYNCSMLLMTTGARAQVWTEFDPARSPRLAAQAGNQGSDQAWISHCLGSKEQRWSRADGVYSFRNDLRRQPQRLPSGARLVVFHGGVDPWSPEGQRVPWVRSHYR